MLKITECGFSGVFEIKLSINEDHRGWNFRLFDAEIFRDAGLPDKWVQENVSCNKKKGTIRGLHFMLPPHTDGKLIRCSKGAIVDVIVDLRINSDTFGKWNSFRLEENDFKWLYIPKGFAHGFCTLKDQTEMVYKHDMFYSSLHDSGILWNDSSLGIEWPVNHPILSEKDQKLMSFKDFVKTHKGL